MKTTKQFVDQFRLNEENFEFKREDFLLELNNYFLDLIYQTISPNTELNNPEQYLRDKIQDGKFNFDLFRKCVKQVEQKFWAISNKKSGKPFTKKLWCAFYAIYVVPLRAKLFPEIEKSIAQKRLEYKSRDNNTKNKHQ